MEKFAINGHYLILKIAQMGNTVTPVQMNKN